MTLVSPDPDHPGRYRIVEAPSLPRRNPTVILDDLSEDEAVVRLFCRYHGTSRRGLLGAVEALIAVREAYPDVHAPGGKPDPILVRARRLLMEMEKWR